MAMDARRDVTNAGGEHMQPGGGPEGPGWSGTAPDAAAGDCAGAPNAIPAPDPMLSLPPGNCPGGRTAA